MNAFLRATSLGLGSQRAWRLGLLCASLGLMSACGGTDAGFSLSGGKSTVVYRLTGSAAVQVSATWRSSSTASSTQTVTLPWTSSSYTFAKGDTLELTATNAATAGNLTAEILVNDVVFKSNTVQAANAQVTISGSCC